MTLRPSKPITMLGGLLAIGVLGALDLWTGAELSFSIFYLLPISLVAWRVGRTAGLLVSGIASLVWLRADDLAGATYSHPLIPFWNMGVRMGFFVVAVVLLTELHRHLDRERSLARTDPLTGLANSRHFRDVASAELVRLERYGGPLTAAYLDVDGLKRINDRFGHTVGDRLLCTVAEGLVETLRASDVCARLGGDEFAVLLPETGTAEAGELLRRVIGELTSGVERQGWEVGFSVGAITCHEAPASVDELLCEVDALMYRVKARGEGGVELSELGAPAVVGAS